MRDSAAASDLLLGLLHHGTASSRIHNLQHNKEPLKIIVPVPWLPKCDIARGSPNTTKQAPLASRQSAHEGNFDSLTFIDAWKQ